MLKGHVQRVMVDEVKWYSAGLSIRGSLFDVGVDDLVKGIKCILNQFVRTTN